MNPLSVIASGCVLVGVASANAPVVASRVEKVPASVLRADPGAAPGTSGTVSAIQLRISSTMIVLSHANGRTITLRIRGRGQNVCRIVTADGNKLRASDVRIGDHVTVRSRHQIVDDSQQLRRLTGIVQVGPSATGDPVIFRVGHSWTIVADLSGATKYLDKTHDTAGAGQLEDSDEVRVIGVYDGALGEITRTDSIDLLGPSRTIQKAKA